MLARPSSTRRGSFAPGRIFGLPEFTLMAVLGGSISNANDADGWRRFFELIQHPDWQDSRPDFEARYGALRPDDLYPDAVRAIEGLKERGYRVAITANQPARRHAELEALGVNVEAMGMSDAMGASNRTRRSSPGRSSCSARRRRSTSHTSAIGSTTTCAPPRRPGCAPSGSGAVRGCCTRIETASRTLWSARSTSSSNASMRLGRYPDPVIWPTTMAPEPRHPVTDRTHNPSEDYRCACCATSGAGSCARR